MPVSKKKLSGSTDGMPIKVATNASLGTTIHTAVAGTGTNTFDEVWLWGYNSSSLAITLTIQNGSSATPDNDIKATLASQSGLIPILPGLILQNGKIVRAYASTANKVTLMGFINAISS